MKWHIEDIPSLLLHLPDAIHDLMHHEDKILVAAAERSLKPAAGEQRRHHIVDASGMLIQSISDQPQEKSPEVSIEKTLDPLSQRAAQNIGLLLHDYLYRLPSYSPDNHEGEKLMEHWRKIIQEQPHRLAVAKSGYWNTPQAKEFWKSRLVHYRTGIESTASGVSSPFEWEDWQRMAGIHSTDLNREILHPSLLSEAKARQWQDLVIRSRMHERTKAEWGNWI